jgi:NADH dehydrogenase FAD-containing subunit
MPLAPTANTTTPKASSSSSSKNFADCPSVVIIGHGLAGRETAKALLAQKQPPSITIVEANDFYECDITGPKSLAMADKYETAFSAPQCQLEIDGVEYVRGKVTAVTKSSNLFEVVVNDTKTIVADGVVVATGFSVGLIKPEIGDTYDQRKTKLNQHREALAAADNIIIAGGGPVGVDINGELLSVLKPGATITHVVSDEALFLGARHSHRERKLVTDRIKSRPNVSLVFGEKVADGGKSAIFEKGKEYTLQSGKKIKADVYIPAFASFDRAQFLSAIPGALAANGTVAVDTSSLMCKGAFNLYAVGCSDCGEMASIPKITAQAASVAKNLEFTLAGNQPSHKHSEAVAFMTAEALVPYGDWLMVSLDELGPLGAICFCCGFPFPCCLAPCVPACGLCGNNCSRPVGAKPASFWDWAMTKGPAGPVLEKADKTKLPPGKAGMER